MQNASMTPRGPAGSPAAARARWADRLGLGAGVACALHCLATAWILTSFPAFWLQLRFNPPAWAWVLHAEPWLARFSLLLVVLALLLAGRRLRAPGARMALVAGAVSVALGLWFPPLAHSVWSIPAVSGGALLIALGHFLHLRGWRRSC